MCPSVFRVSSPQSPWGEGAGSNLDQNLPWKVGKCVQNFIKIGAGVWISNSPPHTNRQTNKHLYAHFYIYRFNEMCRVSIPLDQDDSRWVPLRPYKMVSLIFSREHYRTAGGFYAAFILMLSFFGTS